MEVTFSGNKVCTCGHLPAGSLEEGYKKQPFLQYLAPLLAGASYSNLQRVAPLTGFSAAEQLSYPQSSYMYMPFIGGVGSRGSDLLSLALLLNAGLGISSQPYRHYASGLEMSRLLGSRSLFDFKL